ncbi:MAG TPA: phosphatase PAP2 family protein [Epsilonproteobacteria bacterium]|nr:phosphatase PAP2 family protein [Campylobacterota bacterium]
MIKGNEYKKPLLLLNIVSLLVFIFIFYCVTKGNCLTAIDEWVNTHIVDIQTPSLTTTLAFITNLSGLVGNSIFAIFAILFLSYKKWYKERLFYLLSFSGAVILFGGIKQIVARARPHSDLIEVINYSFPSGHSILTMTTSLLVYFIFVRKLTSPLAKNSLLAVCITWAIFIAFTRVYLNVHWLSDIVAGLTLGIFWVTFMRLYFVGVKTPHEKYV